LEVSLESSLQNSKFKNGKKRKKVKRIRKIRNSMTMGETMNSNLKTKLRSLKMVQQLQQQPRKEETIKKVQRVVIQTKKSRVLNLTMN
jgi:hypothetical protein